VGSTIYYDWLQNEDSALFEETGVSLGAGQLVLGSGGDEVGEGLVVDLAVLNWGLALVHGLDLVLLEGLSPLVGQDLDAKSYDVNMFKQFIENAMHHYIMSYDWPEVFDKNSFRFLYMYIVLDIIDTTVVTSFGSDPVSILRGLPSGAYLTASMGSHIHGSIQCGYNFNLHTVADRIYKQARALDLTIDEKSLLNITYYAFKIGSRLLHYSDDEKLGTMVDSIPWENLVNRKAYYAYRAALTMAVEERPRQVIEGLSDIKDGLKKIFDRLAMDGTDYRAVSEEKLCSSSSGKFFMPSYDAACNDYYPFLSTMNDDCTDFKTVGLSFLKHYYVVFDDNKFGNVIIPIRKPLSMFSKLYHPRKEFRGDIYKRVLQMRQYAYSTFAWPAYDKIKEIHDTVIERFFKDKKAIVPKEYFKRTYKMGFDYSDIAGSFPTKDQCFDFYRRNFVSRSPDLPSEIVINLPYRFKFNIWDVLLDPVRDPSTRGFDESVYLNNLARKGISIPKKYLFGEVEHKKLIGLDAYVAMQNRALDAKRKNA